MTAYTVQFVLPVDNPTNNVSVTKGKGILKFFVPLNYPDAHNVTLAELLMAAEHSGLLALSTPTNTNRVDSDANLSLRKAVKKSV